MHTAIDPEQKLTLPGDADKEKYSMTFSEWFDTKSDLINCIQAHGIYIAPRMAEGIGMSFLEALAMGKAIIAHNETTMNEYIENGVNGYLVDFDNPAPVDLSDVATVQKNAYDSAAAGYENWQSDQDKIIEFIKDKK
jgi:glycosyltransferase involved in cell wall biosynthesis